jgi:hypothetical protein
MKASDNSRKPDDRRKATANTRTTDACSSKVRAAWTRSYDSTLQIEMDFLTLDVGRLADLKRRP